eukprot:Hpha_TRINITY_DN26346_c0_g1::TRINITY_DN26346_c0_g1_i1::g.9341::m.9341
MALLLFVKWDSSDTQRPVEVDPGGTVADILSALGEPLDRKLQFQGRDLDPALQLADAGLSMQAQLVLLTRQPPPVFIVAANEGQTVCALLENDGHVCKANSECSGSCNSNFLSEKTYSTGVHNFEMEVMAEQKSGGCATYGLMMAVVTAEGADKLFVGHGQCLCVPQAGKHWIINLSEGTEQTGTGSWKPLSALGSEQKRVPCGTHIIIKLDCDARILTFFTPQDGQQIELARSELPPETAFRLAVSCHAPEGAVRWI